MTQTTLKKERNDSFGSIEALIETYKTKSAAIRYLDSEKVSRGDIARIMNIRYQHVKNVLDQELKRSV